jgi:molybdopterin molybdotransferase
MRPGSVTTVAYHNDKLLFGLSGNPSACYVGFELFTRPIIRTMLFSSQPHLRMEKAILQEDFPSPNPFARFVRGKLSVSNGSLIVTPSGADRSNVVTSLGEANSLAILPGGTKGYKAGEVIDVLLLEDQVGSEWPW